MTRRYAARADANQAEIVRLLRQVPGVSVYNLRLPCDLVVGYRGINHLIDIKNPNRLRGNKETRTKLQIDFNDTWTGREIEFCETFDDVCRAIGVTG